MYVLYVLYCTCTAFVAKTSPLGVGVVGGRGRCIGELAMAGLHGVSTLLIVLVTAAAAAGVDPGRSLDSAGHLVDFTDEDAADDRPIKRVMFRSDLGKRDDDDERVVRALRALSRSRSFKTDLGKRRGSPAMFRSDLGRRRATGDSPPDTQRRAAMFRSDLGKRYPYSYSRRMFRTDLGKRQMFRHDLG